MISACLIQGKCVIGITLPFEHIVTEVVTLSHSQRRVLLKEIRYIYTLSDLPAAFASFASCRSNQKSFLLIGFNTIEIVLASQFQ